MYFALTTVLVGATIASAATTPPKLTEGSDLATYRPDLRPPLYHVTHHDPDAITPGYWFVAPYAEIVPEHTHGEFQPGQIGPHIYDNDGVLWSGALLIQNRNAFDFKATTIKDTTFLTFISGRHDPPDEPLPKGAGIIVDASLKIRGSVNVTEDLEEFNMHEFNIIENGKSSLIVAYKKELTDISSLGLKNLTGTIGDSRVQEIDMTTGNVTFEWRASETIALTESYDLRYVEGGFAASSFVWDYVHINSIDKFQNGDYLVSGRYTNCIYRVSGSNASIIWRLGGKNSSFVLNGFNFSGQHDARIRFENSTTTIISFFDNAWDELNRQDASAEVSCARQVTLDTSTSPMTATSLNRWQRPDGQYSLSRGNTRFLPNSNVFVNWVNQGYISEFAADDGRCILEAKWISTRFFNYRAYKFNFTGSPTEPPALKTIAYTSGDESETTASIFFVSWNGATEVALWNFYGAPSPRADFSLVGSVAKKGLETVFMSTAYFSFTFAETVAADGRSLGNSTVRRTLTPNGAHDSSHNLTIADAVHQGGAVLISSAVLETSTVLVTSTVLTTSTVAVTNTALTTSTVLVSDMLAVSSITIPVGSAEERPPDVAPPPTSSFLGPVPAVFIVVLSCFTLAGLVTIVHLPRSWRSWVYSRGIYSSLPSSADIAGTGEMDDLSRDEEAENPEDSCRRRHSIVRGH